MPNHNQYEKITDDVMVVGTGIVLKFTVGLSVYSDTGRRSSYHKEFGYKSSKAREKLVTVKRSFDYYLSFESLRGLDELNGDKLFIRIGLTEIGLLAEAFRKALLWFTDPKYQNLFVKKDGKIIMPVNKQIDPITIYGLPQAKWLKFEPGVFTTLLTDEMYAGVRLYLGSDKVFCHMPVGKLMGLVNFFSTFNMYNAAQNMLNYIQRPPFGEYLLDMDNINKDRRTEERHIGVKATSGRKTDSEKKEMSYFEKMKNLE